MDMRKLKERFDRESAERKQGMFAKLDNKRTNYLRILRPLVEDANDFVYAAGWEHRDVGPEGAKQRFLCPKRMGRGPCPVCDEVKRLYETGVKADKDAAGQLKARPVFFLNVMDVEHPYQGDGTTPDVRVLSPNQTIFDDIMSLFTATDDRTGRFVYGDITDPQKGRTLIMKPTLSDKKFNGRDVYTWKITPEADPTAVEVEGWEEQLHDLSAFVTDEKFLSVGNMQRALEGEVLVEDGGLFGGGETAEEQAAEGP